MSFWIEPEPTTRYVKPLPCPYCGCRPEVERRTDKAFHPRFVAYHPLDMLPPQCEGADYEGDGRGTPSQAIRDWNRWAIRARGRKKTMDVEQAISDWIVELDDALQHIDLGLHAMDLPDGRIMPYRVDARDEPVRRYDDLTARLSVDDEGDVEAAYHGMLLIEPTVLAAFWAGRIRDKEIGSERN